MKTTQGLKCVTLGCHFLILGDDTYEKYFLILLPVYK